MPVHALFGMMPRSAILAAALLATAAVGPGCSASSDRPPTYPLDAVLRLNHVQAKGTHNSYHLEPESPVHSDHRYSHAPLDVQLEEQGVRQLEFDLHLRRDQGFEVFHLPLMDQDTTCRRFVDCLAAIKTWSDAHPLHMPIMIWLELKDGVDPLLDETLEYIAGHYDEIEADILSVWPLERILTPDEVRGEHTTLPEAIADHGFPTLGELRGRVIFSMLEGGSHRDAYTADASNLAGKLMFVESSAPDEPFAAMFKIDNARDNADKIRVLVEAGFVVTTRTDGAGESDDDNADRLAASLATGCNYLSSDFPAQVEGRGYWFDMPEGGPARCNPVSAPAECRAEDIESLP